MGKKALKKEFFMSVKKTRNRFISICLIVVLGTAFYAGIRAANPDMQQSADRFFDESRLMDIRVMSTLGLTDDDVSAIKNISGVEAVQPAYSADVLTMKDDSQLVLKLMSVPDEMNLISVDEGRLPQKSGECLVDNLLIKNYGYKIGDTIEIHSGDEDGELADTVAQNKYTIVGRGRTALYLNLTRDSSNIGNGAMTGFVIIPKQDFNLEAYTEIGVRVSGAETLDCYSDAYETLVDGVVSNVEAIADVQCETRYHEVISKAQTEIDDAQKELSDGRQELLDAKQKIEDGEAKLTDAVQTIQEKTSELEENEALISDKEKVLNDSLSELSSGWTAYYDGLYEANNGKTELDNAESQLNAQAQALEDGVTQLEQAKAAFEQAQTEIDTKRAEAEAGLEQVNTAKTARQTLEEKASQLAEAKEAFEAQKPGILAQLDGLKLQLDKLEAAIEAEPDEAVKEELKAQYAALKTQYDSGVAALEATEAEFSKNEAAINEALAQLPPMEEIEANLQALETGLAELDKAQKTLDEQMAAADIEGKSQEIEAGRQAIEAGRQTIAAGRQEIAAAYVQLEQAYATLSSGQTEAEAGAKQLSDAKARLEDGRKAIANAEKEIEENRKKLSDAREEYEKAEAENMPDIEKGEQEIADAQAALDDIELPEWYVLDREYIQTCVEYAQDAERIGAIGQVFPVIFFLVAALVCLTTMTRMVEEERTQIGTLKALGYSKLSIAAKYVLYAFAATIIGGVVGTVLGQKLLPYVIMNAYGIVYVTLTEYVTPLHFGYTVTSILAAVASTILAVAVACYKELRAVPAQLMRPEAPKAGKRVLLERVTFIWKHLSFSNKSTVRNLFRYKKRFLMTVIGIGGCMGLLLVGFGVEDSIMTIGDKQFNEIRIYDGNITLSEDSTDKERQQIYDEIKNEPNVDSVMFVHEETVDVSIDDKGRGARNTYLFVPSELDRMSEFINLRDRIGKETYRLGEDGAIISEKLAKLLDVSEGDSVYIDTGDMHRVPVQISHIAENYFFHYIYLSPALYEKVYGEAAEYTEIFMKNKEDSKAYEEEFSGRYLEKDNVSAVTFIRSTSDRIREMIGSMDVIIYVIIISAGLLAFVVLYNLNNINISERRRELATLKVLGFYDMEVSKYVFRENVLLTFFGAIFGIFLGIILHRYVILTAEIDMMMFGRNIYFKSYIFSILLTFAFSFIVNAVTHWKLKKIDMIESLKSVE